MKPVNSPWWDTCVAKAKAPYYPTRQKALDARESQAAGYFIWGDRVKVISGDIKTDKVVKVAGRGKETWVRSKHLGGDPLLELYVIDVGQGDGLLLVTPEGHNIMVDGGDTRSRQNSGKNAADFVDWKFYFDYLRKKDRRNPDNTILKLDAMIASHNDIDHFGGLFDLLNFKNPKNDAELNCSAAQVENFFHAGLSWWFDKKTTKGKTLRTLGTVKNGYYTKLLGDRATAISATKNLNAPDRKTLNGTWGKFIASAVKCKRATDPSQPTSIQRLSQEQQWLPGFSHQDAGSKVSIRVLGPIAQPAGTKVGLKKFSDDNSKNTNGHSVVLRVDYGDRRFLLTGDLNTHSQNHLMNHYGRSFAKEFGCDVAKGCHHGSSDVSYQFLKGLAPVATVISSGDTESHDHPRPNIVAASALTGRKLLDQSGGQLIMPLVYMTEISRSYALGKVNALHEFAAPRPEHESIRPTGAEAVHNTKAEKSRFRAFLNRKPTSPAQWPRLDQVKTVKGLVYGLINVRTDGKDLLFAAMEEKGKDWSITVLTDKQIRKARIALP